MGAVEYSTLVSELESIAQDPPSEVLQDDRLRGRLLKAAQNIVPQIEKPNETTQRIIYTPLELMAGVIGSNLHIFEILSQTVSSLNTTDLAAKTGADPALLERLLKYFASLSMVKEVDAGVWAASRLTATLATPGIAAGLLNNHVNLGRVWLEFPTFLEKNKYQTVADPRHCVFSEAHQGRPAFEWLEENPTNAQIFSLFMTQQRFAQKNWLDGFPFEEVVCKGESDSKRPLFVDVGGGRGHQCEAVLARFPYLAGRVILEDQASMLSDALSIEGVRKIAIDLFKEQPIKGARAYYLRNVLHDWPDEKSLAILSHLKRAMSPTSVLLIDEMIVPTKGAHKITMQVDMAMYGAAGAEERTEKRWNDLISRAGFKIDQVYTYFDELKDSIMVLSIK
ncbi:o-methyltransferas-like protein [Viridothelium virens]|uniref:O-methyltransferas-like protein n=1 Tax=Viridothelium virens TaxID=1048519 RepID=A0A6A6H2Q8_VIRVR|nr:o-methyltransferas-like protein [Viridothelium virens]